MRHAITPSLPSLSVNGPIEVTLAPCPGLALQDSTRPVSPNACRLAVMCTLLSAIRAARPPVAAT